MGQALYRKYRSKTLDDVVGQKHITETLKNALKAGKISHAYLFTGPRGVGKTSIARILAHEVNELVYSDDEAHLDIIEIDAASNRRIDEIRELRERVHIAPTSAKYKVYIIDEVHMLTKEAFNALLKTLEEPPAHVIFILATTEAHKLPETIVSRTQRFTFKPITDTAIATHLRTIAEAEKIKITDDALELIAKHGAGSFRDSIGLLDQLSGDLKTVTKQHVEQLLGVVTEEAITQLVDAVLVGSTQDTVKLLEELLISSSANQIAKQLNQYLQSYLVGNQPAYNEVLTTLMRALIDVPASHDPNTALYVAILEATLQKTPVLRPNEELQPSVIETEVKPSAVIPEPMKPAELEVESLEPHQLWPQVLAEIKKYHNTLYSVARMARASINGDQITLEFEFPFHQKRLEEPKNKQIVADILRKLGDVEYTITSHAKAKTNSPKVTPKTKPLNATVSTISNIFGDAEVLES